MRQNPYDAGDRSRANLQTIAVTCAALCVAIVVAFCAMATTLQPRHVAGLDPLPALRWDDIQTPGAHR